MQATALTPPATDLLDLVSGRPAPTHARSHQVRAVLLLAAPVRRTRFVTSIGRSPLDLPVGGGATVLELWCDQVARLAKCLGISDLQCRLLLGGHTALAGSPRQHAHIRLTVEADPAPLRGTGGLLHDLAKAYGEDDYLVVATATQVLLEPLEGLIADAVARRRDVTVIHDHTGSPTSVFVVACRALRSLPSEGFVDLKEQALARIATAHSIDVMTCPVPLALPTRTAESYLEGLRQWHRRFAGEPYREPFAERWQSDFAIIEDGAIVSPGARLHNSVVLRGAVVEAGSTVACSLLCPGARARAGRTVQMSLLTSEQSFPLSD